MSSTYTTSTASVSFTALADSWSEEASAEVNVLGFPGGDAVAISIAGQRETRRTFTAMFASVTAYRTFATMLAREGTLLVETWDTVAVPAILIRVSPEVPWMSGEITCKVQFLLY